VEELTFPVEQVRRQPFMRSVNIRELKNNPSDALRLAREDVVVMMNQDTPDAILMHLDDERLLSMPGVRLALATALFREGDLSLGRAAKVAHLALVDFIQHLSRLGIPVVRGTAEDVRKDEEAISAWLNA
jgi:predicted HTH domain antitoxin